MALGIRYVYPRFDQGAKMGISNAVVAIRPQIGNTKATWAVREPVLANNPYEPPSNGKCPIHELPAEILRHIFEIGAEMLQVVEVENKEEVEEDEDDDGFDAYDGSDVYDGVDRIMSGSLLSSGSSIFSSADDFDGLDRLTAGSLQVGSSEASSSSIFGAADDESPLGYKNPLQILVSHVCRYWREVALNSHTLWTFLFFGKILQLERSKAFIERAHGLPLNIFINCTPDSEEVDVEDHPDHPLYSQNKETCKLFLSQNDLTQILDLIEPEVSHWGALRFHASSYGYVRCLLSRLHKIPNAPLLRKLHLYHFGEHHHDIDDLRAFNDEISYVPFHGNAPLLESAIFWSIYIDWDKSLHFLQGLREFELSFHFPKVRPSYTTFTQIIKNSPQLRTLSLTFSGPFLHTRDPFDDEGQWGPEPFEIPSVHRLTLQSYEFLSTNAFIQHFYFPNLRSLILDIAGNPTSFEFVRQLLIPVKGRSTSILAELEHLEISELLLSSNIATTEAMLNQLTNLKILELNCVKSKNLLIFRKLIDPMAGRNRKQGKTQIDAFPKIFCPLLETFVVAYVNGCQLKCLVMAREKAGAPLKTLRLRYKDCMSRKLQEWLQNHVEVVEFYNVLEDDSYDSDYSYYDSYASESEEEE